MSSKKLKHIFREKVKNDANNQRKIDKKRERDRKTYYILLYIYFSYIYISRICLYINKRKWRQIMKKKKILFN